MSSLSTLEEYESIAAGLALPKGAYIDSKFCSAKSGDEFETVNPANGQVLANISHCGQEEVDHAVLKAREEIFGPVLAITTVSGDEQAIQTANDTNYGLAASVFTSNLKRAHRMAKAIRAGTVTVNCFGEGDITTPFGGYKQSGFGGRGNSIHAHDQYTELKTIWLDISDQAVDSSID
jgi:acyl-CoA reductase-like NAD-dependent aldehyde dehydrogenase